jgi:endonuclease/exonuclease/phosphatase family metal-dependent hydrolase
VSAPWATRAKSCSVIDNETVRELSDHGPVVLDLDLGPN